MRELLRLVTLLVIVSSLTGCVKTVTKESVHPAGKRHLVRRDGDTTVFRLEFASDDERVAFADSLQRFLINYPFDSLVADTVRHYFSARLKTHAPDTQELSMAPVDNVNFVVDDIGSGRPLMLPDTTGTIGGRASLYTERGFLDSRFLRLVSVQPLSCRDTLYPGDPGAIMAGPEKILDKRYLRFTLVNPHTIRLVLEPEVLNARGQSLTAFDLVEAWTSFVENHPAEGRAIFRHVKGITAFIRGQEAIISGFRVVDARTVRLTLQNPDSLARTRLETHRLLPPTLKAGPFYGSGRRGNRYTLRSNAHCVTGRPFLDTLVVTTGGEDNPLLGFSMNTHDIIQIRKTEDIEYARDNLPEETRLVPGGEDRYFLSLRIEPAALRRRIGAEIPIADILNRTVKSDGVPIGSLSSDRPPVAHEAVGTITPPPQPMTILYRSDDPVSGEIAEKIFALFSQSGLPGTLRGLAAREYEHALIAGDYALAVGWTDGSYRTSVTEQLRVAEIWFDGVMDETARISQSFEIPLFSLRRHFLCKPDLLMDKGHLTRLYRQQ